MTIGKHASDGVFYGDDAFRSEAKGLNDVAASLAGRARVLYELATGTNPFPSESFASPYNPQREHGCDHSGPPFGSAFLHPIAWMSGKKNSAGNIQQVDDAQPGPGAIQAGAMPQVIGPWCIWVRPHWRLPTAAGVTTTNIAPYDRLYLRGTAHRTGAGTVELDVAFVVLNRNGHQISYMQSTSATLSSSSETAFTINDAWFPVQSGRNIVRLEFTSPTALAGIVVDSITLCQIQKRHH